ncbi:MAG: hypothetical protein AB1411_01895 [Nitrospirota bacterium]
MWKVLLVSIGLTGLLSGCVHQESYEKIVFRVGKPTKLTEEKQTYTAFWGEGPNTHWVVFDRKTGRIVDSSENGTAKCRLLGLCEFTLD